jgi:hypothetical protein
MLVPALSSFSVFTAKEWDMAVVVSQSPERINMEAGVLHGTSNMR